MNSNNRLQYDPGEKRFDHKRSKGPAEFQMVDGRLKGQCPTSITNMHGLAEQLLNDGIYDPGTECIYNVHRGVVYRAAPTILGISYHGFPEREERKRRVPDSILFKLAQRAKGSGDWTAFRQWMEEHLPVGWKKVVKNLSLWNPRKQQS